MSDRFTARIADELARIRADGLWKAERVITSPQSGRIDAALAQDFAARMLDRGVYVVGFSFPVVPRGQARIRTQMSAAHAPEDVAAAVAAFAETGRELGVIR